MSNNIPSKEQLSASGIIEPDVLASLLAQPAGLKLVDASYGPSAYDGYTSGRIDTAVYFDIDLIADPAAPLPHTLPQADKFAQDVTALGISNDDFVVVYDQSGMAMAASRVWWMFRVFGHTKVCVLNGGLPAWKRAGLPIDPGIPPAPTPAMFKAVFQPNLFQSMQDIQQAVRTKNKQIIDARSAERFGGEAPDPRPGVASGHIPGSSNLPYMDILGPDGCFKPASEVAAMLRHAGFGGEKEAIATCGSGVTACVLALACHNTGLGDVAVYDGSWTEWSRFAFHES